MRGNRKTQYECLAKGLKDKKYCSDTEEMSERQICNICCHKCLMDCKTKCKMPRSALIKDVDLDSVMAGSRYNYKPKKGGKD